MSYSTNIAVNGDQVFGTDAKGGIELPRGTTMQRPTSPRLNAGTIRWNTSQKFIEFYTGTVWERILSKTETDELYVKVLDAVVKSRLDMTDHLIKNVSNPIDDQDAVNKRYLEWRVTDGWIDADALGGLLPADYALSARKISAGYGLGGGGDLKQDRSIFMLEPDDISTTSVNEATLTGHTHKLVLTKQDIDNIVGFETVDTIITAGQGLTGGGRGAVTINMGAPSAITVATTNSTTEDSHTHQLVLTSQNIIDIIGYVPADQEKEIVAGAGLTGGGKLKDNPVIAMKSPKTISFTTGNSIDSDGHTHDLALDENTIRTIAHPPATSDTDLPIGTTVIGGYIGRYGSEGGGLDPTNWELNPTYTAYMSRTENGLGRIFNGVGRAMVEQGPFPVTPNIAGRWQWRGFITVLNGTNSSNGSLVYMYYHSWQRIS